MDRIIFNKKCFENIEEKAILVLKTLLKQLSNTLSLKRLPLSLSLMFKENFYMKIKCEITLV